MDITWVNAVGEIAAKQGASWEYTEKDGFIKWTEGTSPTESEITAKISEMEAEYNANQYQRDRQAEYPALVDQLDEIYHNGINAWKAVIKVTKDKYPKG